jgi:CheY-like chemotaxis protein
MNSAPLTVLVADDDIPNRLLLQAILEKQGYRVLLADDGVQAVALFERENPDLVLMDIRMPRMDGYEATRRIKGMSDDTFVPVIFLTATSDNEGLVKCIESGGDDFLTKPYNHILLHARIDALLRIRDLYSTVQQQRNELASHQKRLDRERQLAKRLFTNIVDTDSLCLPNIKSMLSPLSLFSGDILLAAPKPSGGLHVLLGDFTGHGLAAATGALPVSSVFYGMTGKGYSVAEIVTEINAKLKTILPTDMFLAAGMVDMSPTSRTLSVWNGGIPPLIIYGEAERGIVKQIKSRHLPLGIVADENFDRCVDIVEMREGDRVYICSDGVTETVNPDDEMFGRQRLETVFERNRRPDRLFDEIRDSVQRFQAGVAQQDDVTLIELEYQQAQLEAMVHLETGSDVRVALPPATWSLSMELGADLVRHFDPLPLLIQSVSNMQGFRGQRQQLYTLFSELFSNALDHGLLDLDSQVKATSGGFARFYRDREARLAELTEGKISVDIRHRPEDEGGELTIRFLDTGRGFDYRADLPVLTENRGYSGRGIQLLRTLCDKVCYEGVGNVVEVVYRWR